MEAVPSDLVVVLSTLLCIGAFVPSVLPRVSILVSSSLLPIVAFASLPSFLELFVLFFSDLLPSLLSSCDFPLLFPTELFPLQVAL